MSSAPQPSISIVVWMLALVRLKCCFLRPIPPASIAAPSTSSMLPMIEPTIEALTTSCSPWPRAKRAMISSGALPKVTLRRPPMPGPERAASSSVARPISAAVGTIPSADAAKITVAGAPSRSRATATGISGASRYGQPVGVRRKDASRRGPAGFTAARPARLFEQARALLQVGRGLGLLQALHVFLLGLGAALFGAFRGGAAAGRAPGDAVEQPTEPAAAARFQQFDRVDPELQEQLFQWLRVGGRFEALFFVDAVEAGFQLEFHLFALRLRRFDRQFHGELADDVVVADGDFDVRPLDRLRQFALGFFQFAQRQRAGRFQLRAAGRVFGQLDQRVDRAGVLEVGADLRRRGASDVLRPFVFEVLDELRDFDAFRRLL